MASEDIFGSRSAKPDSGFHRIHTIINAVHSLTQTKWKARNKTLHETQDADIRNIRDAEAAEIVELYSHPEKLKAGDRHYCGQPLSAILKISTASRRRWLRYIRQAQASASKDGTRQTLMTIFSIFSHSRTTLRHTRGQFANGGE